MERAHLFTLIRFTLRCTVNDHIGSVVLEKRFRCLEIIQVELLKARMVRISKRFLQVKYELTFVSPSPEREKAVPWTTGGVSQCTESTQRKRGAERYLSFPCETCPLP